MGLGMTALGYQRQVGILECPVGAYLKSEMLFSYSSIKIQF